MYLSIIIPVFNEINFLQKILSRLIKCTPKIKKEIIVIDDCSNDGTKEWLKKILDKNFNYINYKKNKLIFKKNKSLSNLKIILKNKNEGKGSAVKLGLRYCKNDIIVIQDADLEYNPKDLNILINKIKKKDVDAVFGDRFFYKSNNYHYFFYYLGNFFLSSCITFLFGKKISDVAVCYKMFKKKVIKDLGLKAKDFMFDFEFSAKILKKNKFNIINIPISYEGRTFKEGKKISWIDGFRALLLILKIRLFY